MRNAHVRYRCYPSVVPVGQEVEVSIFPCDISRMFRDDKTYELAVVDIGGDQLDYHEHIPLDHPCFAKDGCLRFTHTFESEQEYSIRFTEKGGTEIKIPLYAVETDLYERRPLKGELHTHTYYSDGQDGIAMTPSDYREEGFDFVSITDHNRMYPSVMAADLFKDIPLGLHIMTGEEVHTPGSILHIVHAGGTESVCDRYVRHRDEYEREVDEICATLPDVNEQYRHRTAMAVWACREIHKAGGIAIFAHPFWRPNRYNVTHEFADVLFDKCDFDALELAGCGSNTATVNKQLALWEEQAFKGNKLPAVGSSDSHNHDFNGGSFARRFTLVFAKDNTTESILQAVRDGYCLAAELSLNDDNEARFFGGDLRLVLFAQFLFDNYFNETWRLCVGEGILMRRYAQGDTAAAAPLAALCNTVCDFYETFYGKRPAPIVPADRRAYLDACREVQLAVGPETKGSNLFFYGGNLRRD